MFGRLRNHRRLSLVACACSLLAVSVGALFYFGAGVPEAKELRAHVRGRPPVPVVFTSRSSTASLEAAAPEGEGFTHPGTSPWAAAEGRLRLLDTDGKVCELTWQRELPGGGTLIDVMSPSVSLDGSRILFAGRKAPPDAGRWRIYEVSVTGRGLKQLTGLDDDPGCVALPPMRFAADGSLLPDGERKRLDYDDVDPCDDGAGGIIFASSRLPDLGRDHACRATQIWSRPAGAPAPHPLTANRNNDRWPVLTAEHMILFSSWSRNREVVTEDGTEVRPVAPGGAGATRPTDQWMAARVFPDGSQFGYAVKIAEPVWRPRPLFNGRVAFATAAPDGGFRLAAAEWGYLRAAPSSLALGAELPRQTGGAFEFGPARDASGRALSACCPSPCPPTFVLFAAAPAGAPASEYGLYLVPESFGAQVPQLLFDDPALVDAEPVAVYKRDIVIGKSDPITVQGRPERIRLLGDRWFDGPAGLFENNLINEAMPDPFPGQATDAGQGPVVPHPDGLKALAVYAAHRDRFDDPAVPRVPGGYAKLLVAPLDERGHLSAWIPSDPLMPIVIAGLGADGKVFKWSSRAADSAGRTGTYYALAGDHYSGVRAGGYHFCLGCHTGHTFITADIRERTK
jgi:hypothetical protein